MFSKFSSIIYSCAFVHPWHYISHRYTNTHEYLFRFLIFVAFLICSNAFGQNIKEEWQFEGGNLLIRWDLNLDKAVLTNKVKGSTSWQGSLLPSFWYQNPKKEKHFSKAIAETITRDGDKVSVALRWPGLGKGKLVIEKNDWGWKFSELTADWASFTPQIIEMYLGASVVTNGANVKPTWDRPFMPDWQSFGYCVPGAKAGTVQSYFRSWDFGHTTIALGNFGPSMGTPYGAAFPRPVLFAGVGSDDGWLTIGAGAVPAAAMSLKIQSTRGCIQFLYREDLWGAPAGKVRKWTDLARFTIDTTARSSFEKYYASFPEMKKTVKPEGVRKQTASIWNTWGMWRLRKFPILPIADFTEKMHNEIMVLDDPWESSQGSGQPDLKRFPDFYKDLAYIREKKVDVGVWETIGWIKDTVACGLTARDLILDKDGKPCMANWNFDPTGDAYYCLDFSSDRTKKFLWDRTVRIMKEIKPRLIKLDFGYGLPNPDMGAPRNPAFRGERHTYELMQQIVKAAKSVDPEVVIMGYGISPLWVPLTDLVSLDDQGDLWFDLHRGHQEWSVWASLLSGYGVAISGSSCYDWTLDDGILLNSIVLGSPGAVLPSETEDGKPVSNEFLNRRLAVNLWHRRTTHWQPKWYNSQTGSMKAPPQLKVWGRQERFNGENTLTALVLRDLEKENRAFENISWTGSWAIISQNEKDIFKSGNIAVIPFSEGSIEIPLLAKPQKITRQNMEGIKAFDQWQWHNGKLVIKISNAEFADTAGFLIETEQ
jgi:hypothetical protein